ncbi:unnamed protein product [Amoebophrya sp. A120]|nr:unnamed protein product [Amoebophrya sp. A120]|eukprot:GSA120T00016315001.1
MVQSLLLKQPDSCTKRPRTTFPYLYFLAAIIIATGCWATWTTTTSSTTSTSSTSGSRSIYSCTSSPPTTLIIVPGALGLKIRRKSGRHEVAEEEDSVTTTTATKEAAVEEASDDTVADDAEEEEEDDPDAAADVAVAQAEADEEIKAEAEAEAAVSKGDDSEPAADLEGPAELANATAAMAAEAKAAEEAARLARAKRTRPTAETCSCVNEGSDKFTAPAKDSGNQGWLNLSPSATDGTYQDTEYGTKYVNSYDGLPDYGEYCLEWESECPGKMGKVGDRAQQCSISDPIVQCGVDTDLPKTCIRKWCYIRTPSDTNGNIARATNTSDSLYPNCTNADDVMMVTENGEDLYYSYNYCYDFPECVLAPRFFVSNLSTSVLEY